ncbi:ParB/RepB/Spo0J family partition protein [Jannaschia seohaensis]|uniref:ParB-like nuclease domain-containing protein n=1 Tax=Jannaschia seohaensis TaxID=475081 RepID=A0A2Y9B2R2_9RHOB|nr:ParB N-terminal domain-containing protein [Jannaschia seohaensis]PWJ12923.1 ParB-like nuclease family protein [Jannaschia seohaensis]SSA50731.1 ParB-like nuclease domain-containing protein [Jannaschia seohaensis]
MAKRKRLSIDPIPAGIETKSMMPPVGGAPIAQVAGSAAEAAAMREMSDYLAEARAKGLLLTTLPLAKIELDHLERDRLLAEDEEMEALLASLRVRGQQTPIEVARLQGDPRERYGLISGMRRVTALRRLFDETGEARFARVTARVLPPTNAAEAYTAMVEENEIRADLSFWERARVVLKAVEAGAFPDRASALKGLYGSVSRAKRSKIGSFVTVVAALDGRLRFPTALSEKRGLALAKALSDPAALPRIEAALRDADPQDAEAEQALLMRALAPAPKPPAPPRAPAPVTVAREGDRLIVSGPGVDAALLRDLRKWLSDRV